MSTQLVIISGYVAKDPETRYLQSGDAVCNFSIPIGEKWTDKDSGESKERTTWFNVVCYRKMAEVAGEYLKKGSYPTIVGKIITGEYENKEGATIKTWTLAADKLDLGPRVAARGDGEPAPEREASKPAAKQQKSADGDFDDDIPF